MKNFFFICLITIPLLFVGGCKKIVNDETQGLEPGVPETAAVPLGEVAKLIACLPLGSDQVREVADAVESSSGNGYDEEYRMNELFATPGSGVGELPTKAASRSYLNPIRDMIAEEVARRFATRSDESGMSPGADDYLATLAASDIQIYWPYSERWDGKTMPVISFHPGGSSEVNVGYTLDGEEVLVDEALASERPVWIINRNEDAGYETLETLRRDHPEWTEGGTITIKAPATRASDIKTLVLTSFKANRNYDSWFSGGSEFFIKTGSVKNFTASTEAELRLYKPSITDFMIVVKRSQIGETLPFGAVLVSEWTWQLDQIALMIVEDDGGTITSWKCSAVVKYNSKSYGFELEIPLYSRDDIVWRGQLSRKYIEKYSGATSPLGDVELVLELI